MSDAVKTGDRIRITIDSASERPQLTGTVLDLIPGYAPETSAALVQLDAPISVESVTGDMLVMELRYEGASWEEAGDPGAHTVGLDLYSGRPSISIDPHVAHTTIETHAVFRVLPS